MGSLPEDEVEDLDAPAASDAAPAAAPSAVEESEPASEPTRNPDAIELPAAAADREAMTRRPEEPAPVAGTASDSQSGELEDLLGRARETAETAALEAAVESELELSEGEVIDDFAHPPLDDDPLQAEELAAERAAEEHARGNGER
jgi:hypothetical protein